MDGCVGKLNLCTKKKKKQVNEVHKSTGNNENIITIFSQKKVYLRRRASNKNNATLQVFKTFQTHTHTKNKTKQNSATLK